MAVGKDKYFAWDYSEKSDILNVHKINKKTAGSAELGDFTVDFDKSGNVVGIEIMNASEFFNLVKINMEQLKDIKEAEILIQKKGEYMLVCLKLLLPKNVERIIPLPATVVSESMAVAASA